MHDRPSVVRLRTRVARLGRSADELLESAPACRCSRGPRPGQQDQQTDHEQKGRSSRARALSPRAIGLAWETACTLLAAVAADHAFWYDAFEWACILLCVLNGSYEAFFRRRFNDRCLLTWGCPCYFMVRSSAAQGKFGKVSRVGWFMGVDPDNHMVARVFTETRRYVSVLMGDLWVDETQAGKLASDKGRPGFAPGTVYTAEPRSVSKTLSSSSSGPSSAARALGRAA